MYSMQTARCCKTYKVSTSRRLVMQVRQTSSQKPPLQPNNFMPPWSRLGSSHCAFLQGSTANCRSCLTACRAACSWLSSSLENHNYCSGQKKEPFARFAVRRTLFHHLISFKIFQHTSHNVGMFAKRFARIFLWYLARWRTISAGQKSRTELRMTLPCPDRSLSSMITRSNSVLLTANLANGSFFFWPGLKVRCLATCESNFGKGRWTKKITFAFVLSIETYEECMGQCFRGLSLPRGWCQAGRKPRSQILWDKVYVVFYIFVSHFHFLFVKISKRKTIIARTEIICIALITRDFTVRQLWRIFRCVRHQREILKCLNCWNHCELSKRLRSRWETANFVKKHFFCKSCTFLENLNLSFCWSFYSAHKKQISSSTCCLLMEFFCWKKKKAGSLFFRF